jgi:hypothetical protein
MLKNKQGYHLKINRSILHFCANIFHIRVTLEYQETKMSSENSSTQKFFEKDRFPEKIEKLMHHIKDAESLLTKIEKNEDTRTNRQKLNKTLESASKILQSLFSEIKANEASWNSDVLKKNRGNYDNSIILFKSIQQRVQEFSPSQPKFIP